MYVVSNTISICSSTPFPYANLMLNSAPTPMKMYVDPCRHSPNPVVFAMHATNFLRIWDRAKIYGKALKCTRQLICYLKIL
jgi:hypothetical protein